MNKPKFWAISIFIYVVVFMPLLLMFGLDFLNLAFIMALTLVGIMLWEDLLKNKRKESPT